MENFIAEVFDKTNVRTINLSNYVTADIFSYRALFLSEDLIKTTLINWLYNEIFQTFPSKITVENTFPVVETFKDMYLVFNYRVNDAEKLNKSFDEYRNMIIERPAFLKEQVWKKLRARNMTNNETYMCDSTLFSQFNINYNYERDREFIKARGLHLRNPITQYACSQHGFLPEFITTRDILLHSMFVDKAFMQMIGNVIIVLDCEGALGAIKSLQKRCIIISAVPMPDAHFVCENILEYIVFGIFAPLIYSVNELKLPPQCTLMTPPKQVQEVMNCFPKDADALTEAYFKVGGIPSFVLDHIFSYFMKRMCHKRLIGKDTTANCILIIDSRPNILSVLSVMISHYNIPWNVIVCTPPSAQPFYANHLGSNVKFITHPLIDLERPFDIGDYNKIMKDSSIWQSISDMGYTHCLVIQDDGMIFRSGIERFLQYEYVGAPWPEQAFMREAGVVNPVGNGGLSLRHIGAMIKITQEELDDKNALYFNNTMVIPEDVYFSKFSKTPSVSEAKRFAFEMLYDDNAIGFHKPWPYIKGELIAKYFKQLESMEP
jgi:hypothetical protein